MNRNKQLFSILVVTGALHGMIHTLSLFLSPLNAEVARYFGFASISSVTSFKTSYLIVYAASNLLFGALAHRISARLTLGFGMALNALAVLAFRFVPPSGAAAMYALWMVAAVGGGVYHPVANAFITRVFAEKKGWALGLTGMGAGIGFAFGPLLTGFLSAGLGFDWRAISLVFASLGLACAAAAFIGLRDDVGSSGPAPAAASDPTPADATGGRPVLGLPLPLWGFLGFMTFVAGSRDFAMWSILDISDFYLSELFGGKASTAWYLFVMYLPGVFFQPLAGTFSDKLGRKRLSVITLMLYGLAIASLAVLPPSFLLATYFIMGAAQSASTPVLEAFVADFATPKTRGMIFGVFITVVMGMGAIGPLLAGLFLDAFGRTLAAFQGWMLLLGGVVVLGGIAMVFSGKVVAALGLSGHRKG
jgi:FSR family fosmidomycin resistance protein-like MFS transporter